MIGMEVTSRPVGTGCVTALFFPFTALAVAAAVYTGSLHWGVFALLPLAIGITAILLHDPVVRFQITKEGLAFESPDPLFVRFDEIEGLTTQGSTTGNTFAMQLYYPGGVVRIPATLDVSSWELFKFLWEQMPDATSAEPSDVPQSLRGFLADQIEMFGREKVYVFRARRHAPVSSHAWHVAYSRAVILTGIMWIILGGVLVAIYNKPPARDDSGFAWVGCGFAALLIGCICALGFSRASGSGRVSNWQGSCLIVSPGGIALAQGPLKGKMRWDELRAIELPAKPRFGLSTAGGATKGIGLLVEGAYLIIADYYDRPLALIHEYLKTYWGGRHAN
jgi:hypothetical protein